MPNYLTSAIIGLVFGAGVATTGTIMYIQHSEQCYDNRPAIESMRNDVLNMRKRLTQ